MDFNNDFVKYSVAKDNEEKTEKSPSPSGISAKAIIIGIIVIAALAAIAIFCTQCRKNANQPPKTSAVTISSEML